MIKSAVARTPILAFILMFFALGYTVAHNKVVVVPLGSTEPTLDIYYGSITGSGVMNGGNLQSSSRSFEGSYTITIGRSLAGCAATGNPGWLVPGAVSTDTRGIMSVNVNTDNIRVTNTRYVISTGNFSLNDTDFHLMVNCPKV